MAELTKYQQKIVQNYYANLDTALLQRLGEQVTDLYLAEELGLKEVFQTAHGRPARSFPAALPLFTLDRIYVRGFDVASAQVLHGQRWRRLSDHAALTAQLRPQT